MIINCCDLLTETSKESVKDDEEEKDVVESDVESESEDETKDEDSQTQSDDEANFGLKSLLEDLSVEKSSDDKVKYPIISTWDF